MEKVSIKKLNEKRKRRRKKEAAGRFCINMKKLKDLEISESQTKAIGREEVRKCIFEMRNSNRNVRNGNAFSRIGRPTLTWHLFFSMFSLPILLREGNG